MRFLALLLLAPWLLILAWAYWSYPKSLIVNGTRRAFDVLALLAAALLSVQLTVLAFDSVEIRQVGQFGPESGGIWKQVIPALYAYGGFVAVLAAALLIRHLVWRRRKPE
ncbi:hypothetical protein FHW69_000505 [Luteibacter sp. Sphag1AF]|uniref:hypothetical protein n=1 Tax=Luteibacter sp. Sphag1AF TaxID=2587031 RepID=UPI00161376CC|nr:hypothetical protein [Luteibacter sp. Sphag1AF]MBB3225915.1 hypothetical protein [Luteibacter sp. Sphag1AF]